MKLTCWNCLTWLPKSLCYEALYLFSCEGTPFVRKDSLVLIWSRNQILNKLVHYFLPSLELTLHEKVCFGPGYLLECKTIDFLPMIVWEAVALG